MLMKTLKSSIELRADTRLKAKKGTFVLFGDDRHRIGMLLNISQGGLAFQYVTESEEIPTLSAITVYADGNSSLWLEALPCKIVHDREVIPAVNNVSIRHCGVQFRRLSQYQSARLQRLLSECTMH
jgi:hypothetical protein